MDREKIDMESPELKENPFKVPASYFPNLINSISARVSAESNQKSGVDYRLGIGLGQRVHLWQKIGYAAAISILLIIGYIAIMPAITDKTVSELASTEIDIIESGFLSASFIDFFDDQADISEAIIDEENISEEEIISFLSENVGIMLLTSLDYR